MSERKFEVDFLCDECNQGHIIECTTSLDAELSEGAITGALEVFHPFCCENCGGDSFHVGDWLESETAPLLARIAELENSLEFLRGIANTAIGNDGDVSSDWLLIFVENALKKAVPNE